ncbi:hypothetical protein [uncultured Caulobacter sp.]|uniref:hypothetical protein n=1 Tax=uncultured Caulobacter sp. TaxID=158749 RepID=UPI0026041515|nr:hypothetical protein [uncultured Caulobacter sp.]
MKKTLILAAVLTAIVATPAWAEKTAPAGKVFMFLDKFLKVPSAERARMKLAYAVRRDGRPLPNVTATLVEKNGARTPLPVNADGYFERLPTLPQLAGEADVVFDVPSDWKLGTAIDIRPQLNPAADYDARELVATVDESNRAIGKAAGALSFMAPKMTGLIFPKAESGTVIFADGRSAPLPQVKDAPYFRPADHQGAVRVKLTKTPTKVGFYDGKK